MGVSVQSAVFYAGTLWGFLPTHGSITGGSQRLGFNKQLKQEMADMEAETKLMPDVSSRGARLFGDD